MNPTPQLHPEQFQEIRALVDEAGFLPMSNKAERLFTVAALAPGAAAEVSALREAYQSVGYLSRTKALRLVALAATRIDR
jgi:hypothetical protein